MSCYTVAAIDEEDITEKNNWHKKYVCVHVCGVNFKQI